MKYTLLIKLDKRQFDDIILLDETYSDEYHDAIRAGYLFPEFKGRLVSVNDLKNGIMSKKSELGILSKEITNIFEDVVASTPTVVSDKCLGEKIGWKWDNAWNDFKCSKCGSISSVQYDYYPYCGTKMIGE